MAVYRLPYIKRQPPSVCIMCLSCEQLKIEILKKRAISFEMNHRYAMLCAEAVQVDYYGNRFFILFTYTDAIRSYL